MSQFLTIYKFELLNYVRKKVWLILTIVLAAVIGVVMFIPRLTGGGESYEEMTVGEIAESAGLADDSEGLSGEEGHDEAYAPGNRSTILWGGGTVLISVPDEYADDVIPAFSRACWGCEVKRIETVEETGPAVTGEPDGPDGGPEEDAVPQEIRQAILDGSARAAFVIRDDLSFTYYVENLSMYDSTVGQTEELLKEIYQARVLREQGVSAGEIGEILEFSTYGRSVTLGKDQATNFLYTYIMIFALYMLIMLYGQMVATAVASEKSSRAMELLVTSAKPNAMMFGKVLAAGTAGLIQMAAIFGTGMICFRINRPFWQMNPMVASLFDIPGQLLFYLLVFFVLGFLLYAFFYGAIGSTASKVEDVQTSIMPLTFLFIIAFMVVIFSMTSGLVDNPLLLIASFVPFTSPMAMFTRICMSTVPLWQIITSIAILVASVIGGGVAAARIYRIGVLMYGAPVKPAALFKAIREAKR